MEQALLDQLPRRRSRLVGRRQLEHRSLGEHAGGLDLGIEGFGELAVTRRQQRLEIALVALLDLPRRFERIQSIGHCSSPMRFPLRSRRINASAISRSVETMVGHNAAIRAHWPTKPLF